MPDFDGPRKMPVHGTRGTTGSEGCLLLYSVVGNSLIFPISFALLAKFEAGKPCESGRNAIFTASQPEFFRQRTATQQDADGVFSGQSGGESRSASLCTDALPVFSAQSGRRVWGRSAVQHCASSVFWETPGQSCAHAKIECGNPAPTPGLSGAILCPRQD